MKFLQRSADHEDGSSHATAGGVPGKRGLPPVQRRSAAAAPAPARAPSSTVGASAPAGGDDPFGFHLMAPIVQGKDADPAVGVQAAALAPRDGGAALPGPVQARMEDAFQTDFSDVRVHQGPQAASIGAHAYTSGSDLHFAPGQYDPGSRSGQELIGHELAHVVQQRAGRVQADGQPRAAGDDAAARLNADPALEAEADAAGAKAADGARVTIVGAGRGAQPRLASAAAPVQRYKVVGEHERNQAEGEQLFTSHEAAPSLGDDLRAGPQYKPIDGPEGLLVSDDDALAIHTGGQVQEFFATAGQVQGWNEKLAGNNTQIRLAERESSITVGDHTFVMIKPMLGEQELVSFVSAECFEVANVLLGKNPGDRSFELILAGKDDQEERLAYESKSSRHVAEHMLDRRGGIGTMRDGIGALEEREEGQRKLPYVGKQYGEALGRGKLDDRAEEIGVNEHALPDVGEAYVTYSVRQDVKTEDEGLTDYTQHRQKKRGGLIPALRAMGIKSLDKMKTKTVPQVRPKSWDMHYAGVVAMSPTGSDRITLEDYNRNDEMNDLRAELYERLKVRYAAELEGKEHLMSASEILTELAQSIDGMEWIDARGLANQMVSAQGRSTWYFRMFGVRKDQSFHQLSHEGGDTVNPLTLRVGKR
jgi:hypothetical protein